MILSRSPQYASAPPPPRWLDPNVLGATQLRRVDREQICVILNGSKGLLEFLKGLDTATVHSAEAYVVMRPDSAECYVFSKEQFWLAALMLADIGRVSYVGVRPDIHFAAILRWYFLNARLTFGIELKRMELEDDALVSKYFDIHEYSVSGQFGPGEIPNRPGTQNDLEGKLVAVFIPDTVRLRERSLVLAPQNQNSHGVPSPSPSASPKPDGSSAISSRPKSESGPSPSSSICPKPADGGGHGGALGSFSREDVRRQEDTRRRLAEQQRRVEQERKLEAERRREVHADPHRTLEGGISSEPQINEGVVRRIPHMDLSHEGVMNPGVEFQVSIYANEIAARIEEDVEPITLAAPADVREFEVSVWLVATPHFAIVQPALKTLIIKRDESSSSIAQFDVIVRRTPHDRAVPKITAIFRFNDRACGTVSRYVKLAQTPQEENRGESALSLKALPKLEIHPSAQPADLTVIVTNPANDGRVFECLVSSPLLEKYRKEQVDTWTLRETADKLVSEYFSRFTSSGGSSGQRIAYLKGAGCDLFKAAPPLFQKVFWELIDQGKPLRTISVVSEEAHIPWELMVPVRPGGIDRREPLGVEFSVGRWVSGNYCFPRNPVPLTDSWVFAPRYTGRHPNPLKNAAAEADFVIDKFRGKAISPAVFDELESAMALGGRSLIHFICHGASPRAGGQAIFCEDNSELNSSAIGGAVEIPNACRQSAPFIFLNACDVGRTTPALVGVGGFASAFIELGASCVIAPLWSVKDSIAHQIAREFYEATLADPHRPFAEILSQIRKRAYQTPAGEDTYAAYCFYGDPLASQRA